MLTAAIAEQFVAAPEEGLASSAEILRSTLAVDRVSIATLDPRVQVFRVVAASGMKLFSPGTELPIWTSTQIERAARLTPFVAADFDAEAEWTRPADLLLQAVGFRSGVTLPLVAGDRPLGAISLSSTARGADHTRRLEEVRRVAPLLVVGLSSFAHDPQSPPTLPQFPRVDESSDEGATMTPRECELLAALDEGLPFKEIARRLGLAESTIKGYARNLFRKLGAHSRGEAVYRARRLGLLGYHASGRLRRAQLPPGHRAQDESR